MPHVQVAEGVREWLTESELGRLSKCITKFESQRHRWPRDAGELRAFASMHCVGIHEVAYRDLQLIDSVKELVVSYVDSNDVPVRAVMSKFRP